MGAKGRPKWWQSVEGHGDLTNMGQKWAQMGGQKSGKVLKGMGTLQIWGKKGANGCTKKHFVFEMLCLNHKNFKLAQLDYPRPQSPSTLCGFGHLS